MATTLKAIESDMNSKSSDKRFLSLSPLTEKIVVGLMLLAAATLVILFFDRLPIEGTSLAIDWKPVWEGMRGGVPYYSYWFLNPPWSILPILPLGLLSFGAGWGLLTMLTLMAMILSVPRSLDQRLWAISVILLTVSFPSLRHLVDGNLEGLIIAGIVMSLLGFQKQNPWLYAMGVLLASAKLQETGLFLFVLAMYTLKLWPRRKIVIVATLILAVVVPTFIWKGREWLEIILTYPYPGSIIDITLRASIRRLGMPDLVGYIGWGIIFAATMYITFTSEWTFSRFKAGLLLTASLLLAPYAAGNSFLTVLAIGIIPLFQRYRWLGLFLILLADLPFLASHDLLWWQAYYWTVLLLISWVIFLWLLYREKREA